MSKQRFPSVALAGDGDQAQQWAAALRGQAKVCPLPEQLPAEIDALIIAPGVNNPFARAKEALVAGVPVLYAAPFLLSPWQATTLHRLSSRQGHLLRFAEKFQHRRGFTFLRRLLEGDEPFWRPLYLRSIRLVPPETSTRIDELATEELAICQALLDSAPQQVSATASHSDAVGNVCAAFLTIQYRDGPPVQCTISVAEASSAHQLIAVTSGRTVILDELDPIAPLRVIGAGEQETYTASPPESSTAADRDFMVKEIEQFLQAVSQDNSSFDNSERWANVAALWWAARQSMSFGGPVDVPNPFFLPRDTEPPPFTVIRGGGKTASAAGKRPALTVVAP